MYKSELHNSKETKEILEKGPPDVFFRWYYKKKKGLAHPGVKTVRTSRLDRIENSITKLAEEIRDGFKQVNTRISNLEKDVNSLKQDVKDINTRLDYNGLKKLPENNR